MEHDSGFIKRFKKVEEDIKELTDKNEDSK